jgi:hypothetical protein
VELVSVIKAMSGKRRLNVAITVTGPDHRLRPSLPAGLATAAAAAAKAAAPAAATRACGHGLGLIDGQVAAAEIMIVQLLDRALRFLVGRHLDEAEASGATGCHVAHDFDAFDVSAAREELLEILLARGVRKVPDVEFSTHC